MDTIKRLNNAKKTIEKLLTLMQREQTLLEQNSSTELDHVVDEKNALLQQASEFESLLGQVTDKAKPNKKETKLLAEIRKLLADCKRCNHENRQVASHKVNMVSKSIAYIESMLNIDTVKLYSPKGETDSRAEKRNLGVA